MAYAAAADLLDVLGDAVYAELTADTGAVADAAVALAVLNDVSGTIDSYLGRRYTVPVTVAVSVAVLKPYCLDMAKFKLLGRRLAGRYDVAAKDLYDSAIEWLKAVADGKADLMGATPRPALTTTTGAGGWTSNDPVFTADEYRRV